MDAFLHHRNVVLTVLVLMVPVLFFARCAGDEEPASTVVAPQSWKAYSGSDACGNCHRHTYDAYLKTAHFHTSAVASDKNVLGSFDSGKNAFHYKTGGVVRMEKSADGMYQVAITHLGVRARQRFDMVTGSGTKGQTYLTWSGSHLFQLPVTYFTALDQWCNSPGNPNKIAINRVITSRCLECHTTLAEKLGPDNEQPENFDRGHMILGVSCEKCHGPGAQHIAYQAKHPGEKRAAYIINPARFSRRQSLDLCTLCHGGRLQKIRPSFSFRPGDRLSDFFLVDSTSKEAGSIDVHANQYGLLALSKCFRQSATLTCVSCHNPHENETGNLETFSSRCLACHDAHDSGSPACKLTARFGARIKKNCIDCHMPKRPSQAIAVLLEGSDTLTPALIRTHLVSRYPGETARMLAYINHSEKTRATKPNP